MKCENATILLMDFMYEEIDTDSEKTLRAHLDSCTKCRTEYEGLQKTSLTLQAWKNEEPSKDIVFVEPEQGWFSKFKSLLYPEHVSLGGRLAFGSGVAILTALIVSSLLNMEIHYQGGEFSFRSSLQPAAKVEFTNASKNDIVDQLRQENHDLIENLVRVNYEKQQADVDQRLTQFVSEVKQQRENEFSLLNEDVKRASMKLRDADQRIKELQQMVNFRSGR